MSRAVLASASPAARLEVAVRKDGPWDNEWSVILVTPSLTATHQFHSGDDGEAVAAFFTALAESWRGWDGRRVLDLDADFRLVATHDGVGHIELWVQLGFRPDDASEQWFASAPLQLEAGSLDALARAARELTSESPA